MAKAKHDKDLIDRLHASGVRSRTAELIARATDGRRKPAKQVRAITKEMHKVLAEVEDRASGGPSKRKVAAKKAAQTRKKNAAKRRASAKKGARTKAKSGA
ncbi:MAG TPA: hypothetical protein VHV75_11325 [Solirubrobacteraceae bacterium]|jgi:hypothetical protein|nr:hypothetical protein [Solirubrobacteraceae bacterium]